MIRPRRFSHGNQGPRRNIDELKLEHSTHGDRFESRAARGSGLLRYGSETRKIRAGDFIGCPTSGPETYHQIVNDSDEPLEFISVSMMMPAEVCEYPDSGKPTAAGPCAISRARRRR